MKEKRIRYYYLWNILLLIIALVFSIFIITIYRSEDALAVGIILSVMAFVTVVKEIKFIKKIKIFLKDLFIAIIALVLFFLKEIREGKADWEDKD